METLEFVGSSYVPVCWKGLFPFPPSGCSSCASTLAGWWETQGNSSYVALPGHGLWRWGIFCLQKPSLFSLLLALAWRHSPIGNVFLIPSHRNTQIGAETKQSDSRGEPLVSKVLNIKSIFGGRFMWKTLLGKRANINKYFEKFVP